LKPLEKVDLPEGAKVKIRIEIYGLLEGWKIDVQRFKDELKGRCNKI